MRRGPCACWACYMNRPRLRPILVSESKVCLDDTREGCELRFMQLEVLLSKMEDERTVVGVDCGCFRWALQSRLLLIFESALSSMYEGRIYTEEHCCREWRNQIEEKNVFKACLACCIPALLRPICHYSGCFRDRDSRLLSTFPPMILLSAPSPVSS